MEWQYNFRTNNTFSPTFAFSLSRTRTVKAPIGRHTVFAPLRARFKVENRIVVSDRRRPSWSFLRSAERHPRACHAATSHLLRSFIYKQKVERGLRARSLTLAARMTTRRNERATMRVGRLSEEITARSTCTCDLPLDDATHNIGP